MFDWMLNFRDNGCRYTSCGHCAKHGHQAQKVLNLSLLKALFLLSASPVGSRVRSKSFFAANFR